MEVLERVLEDIPGGAALDVATGSGNFAAAIQQTRRNEGPVIATDAFLEPMEILRKKSGADIIPAVMDAERLAFPDEAFTSAAISNSLHHMVSPGSVLKEMARVLSRGGILLIVEMFKGGGQTPAQQTHNLMHDWWGKVDSSRGIVHNPVYTRAELEELAFSAGLRDLTFETFDIPVEDPFDEDIRKHITRVWESYMKRAAGDQELEARGREVLEHFGIHGFSSARTLIVRGSKA